MSLTPQERDNLTRWDGHQKDFYEAYTLKWNDPSGASASIRYSLTGIEVLFSETQEKIEIRQPFPLKDFRIEKDFFYFSAGDSAIFQSGARGEITDEENTFSWELKFQEPSQSLRHYPTLLYHAGVPRLKSLAPRFSTKISGEFKINDRTMTLQEVPGYQSHQWGAALPSSSVWGHCNAFDDPGFIFEGFSAPPFTILFFLWEGKLYSFNSPTQWIKNKSEHSPDRWHFEAGTKDLLFVGDLHAESPLTLTADLKIQILKKEKWGWEAIKTVTAQSSAAFEVKVP